MLQWAGQLEWDQIRQISHQWRHHHLYRLHQVKLLIYWSITPLGLGRHFQVQTSSNPDPTKNSGIDILAPVPTQKPAPKQTTPTPQPPVEAVAPVQAEDAGFSQVPTQNPRENRNQENRYNRDSEYFTKPTNEKQRNIGKLPKYILLNIGRSKTKIFTNIQSIQAALKSGTWIETIKTLPQIVVSSRNFFDQVINIFRKLRKRRSTEKRIQWW